MTPDDPTTAEEHWASRDPEGQPPRAAVLGLGRQVMECKLRLGAKATPAAVLAEVRAAGLDVTEEQIRAVWDQTE
jgi:hypothetical protein